MKVKHLLLCVAVFITALVFVTCDSGGGTGDPCSNGHDYSVQVNALAATCITAGYTEHKKCSNCDSVQGKSSIYALGHHASNGKEATCTEDGNTGSGKCVRCNEQVTDKVIAKLGHHAPNGIQPTCTEDGNTGVGECERCKEQVTGDPITKLGHIGDAATCTTAQTCTNIPCDGIGLQQAGHTHVPATGVCPVDGCGALTYTIGDTGPGGGIIFYVADGQSGRQSSIAVQAGTGFLAYTAYYLEAAPANVSINAYWGDFGTLVTGVTTGASTIIIGNGRKDTQLIIAHMTGKSISNTAAQLAFAYRAPAPYYTIDDWFLPSLDELYFLLTSGVSGISSGNFWSSTQNNANNAYFVRFSTPLGYATDTKDGPELPVRAIRAF